MESIGNSPTRLLSSALPSRSFNLLRRTYDSTPLAAPFGGGDCLRRGGEPGDDLSSRAHLAKCSAWASSRAFSSASRSCCACRSCRRAVFFGERAVRREEPMSDCVSQLCASAISSGIQRSKGAGGGSRMDIHAGLPDGIELPIVRLLLGAAALLVVVGCTRDDDLPNGCSIAPCRFSRGDTPRFGSRGVVAALEVRMVSS